MKEIGVGQKWKFRHSNYSIEIVKKLNAKCWEVVESGSEFTKIMNSDEIIKDYVISKDKTNEDRRNL
jgi:hypothetical protein